MKPSFNKKSIMILSLFLTVLISGCINQPTSSSLQILSKSFVRDSQGVPIVALVVGEFKATATDFVCRATYSGELTEQATAEKITGGKGSFTITVPASGRLDLNKWGACCDLGTSLNSKTSTTLCKE